ncbi:MAG: hypothetical protein FWD39_03645, partial [Clostridiales bacterium]|nr:hypothetical protein [Clostridiales bacterium]
LGLWLFSFIGRTEERAEYLSIPRGCEEELTALLNSAIQIEDKRNPGEVIKTEFNGCRKKQYPSEIRDYRPEHSLVWQHQFSQLWHCRGKRYAL